MHSDDDDFDKFFGRVFKFGIGAVIVSTLFSLGLLGVIIWAIIYVVTHIGVWFG
jgi:hypothetical protein